MIFPPGKSIDIRLIYDFFSSKSDLRDHPKPPFLSSEKKSVYLKKWFWSIDHHAKYKIFKWIQLDPPLGQQCKFFFWKPLFEALPKICDWIHKYVQIHHVF